MKRYTGWRASLIITAYVAALGLILSVLIEVVRLVLGLSA